eukprot:3938318-Rhodomonas_salina.1
MAVANGNAVYGTPQRTCFAPSSVGNLLYEAGQLRCGKREEESGGRRGGGLTSVGTSLLIFQSSFPIWARILG